MLSRTQVCARVSRANVHFQNYFGRLVRRRDLRAVLNELGAQIWKPLPTIGHTHSLTHLWLIGNPGSSLRLARSCAVSEFFRHEDSSITVQLAEDVAQERSTESLSLATSQTGVGTQTLLKEAGCATSALELVKLILRLNCNCCGFLAVTPAPVANLTECEVQVRAGNTNPITDSFGVQFRGNLLASQWRRTALIADRLLRVGSRLRLLASGSLDLRNLC